MSVDMRVDLRAFEGGLRAWAKAVGADLPSAVRTQMVLLLKGVLRLIPPKTIAVGRKLIEIDLRRAVDPIFTGAPPDNVRIAEMMAAGDLQGLNEIFADSPALGGLQIVPFTPDLHQSARNAKGRVPNSTGLATVDNGEWKRYLEQTQKGVGKAKGAIASTLLRLGQSVPAWIARHAKEGATLDRTRGAQGRIKPLIRMIAHADHLYRLGINRILATAVRARVRAMKIQVKRMLSARARGAGFKVSIIR